MCAVLGVVLGPTVVLGVVRLAAFMRFTAAVGFTAGVRMTGARMAGVRMTGARMTGARMAAVMASSSKHYNIYKENIFSYFYYLYPKHILYTPKFTGLLSPPKRFYLAAASLAVPRARNPISVIYFIPC